MNLLNSKNNEKYNLKKILHAQDQFLEIFFTLNNNDFTPNQNRFQIAPETNYIMLNDY